MSDFKFDQFKISILSFLIVSCQIVVLALVASELFSSSSDLMQGGGGNLSQFLLVMCRWPLRTPTHYTLFFSQLKTPSWLYLRIWFNFLTANLHIFFIPTCQNFLALKVSKFYDLIVETILKMQPHYSQFSRENATQFSGTSPSAYYEELLPPGGRVSCQIAVIIFALFTFPHQILCMGRRSSFFYFTRIFLFSMLFQRFLSDTRTKCRGSYFAVRTSRFVLHGMTRRSDLTEASGTGHDLYSFEKSS